ncbi:TPA: DUF211 domain-containing protein [Candidatus Woesearchaeota archaeon]|nr:DUF211 domain-containing protein [Candidatus Woesearchaeota archaeon]
MPKKEKCQKVRLLVLDVLKPHKPNIVEFSQALCKSNGVKNADVMVYHVDEKTESVKVVCEGEDLHFNLIISTIEDYGAVVHSVDRVMIGEKPEALKLHEYEKKEFYR